MLSGRRQVAFSTDLVGALIKEEAGETPFTPPVQTMYALREALRELLEEGVQQRIAHYRSIAKTLRQGLTSLELAFLVSPEHLSTRGQQEGMLVEVYGPTLADDLSCIVDRDGILKLQPTRVFWNDIVQVNHHAFLPQERVQCTAARIADQ